MIYTFSGDFGYTTGVHLSFDGPKPTDHPFFRKDLSRETKVVPGTYPDPDYAEILPPEVAQYLPKTVFFHLKSHRKRVYTPHDIWLARFLVCSNKFRELVEELEPGGHQFFPVRASVMVKGDELYSYDNYYLMIISNMISKIHEIDLDRTPHNLKIINETYANGQKMIIRRLVDSYAAPIFKEDIIKNWHLWRAQGSSLEEDMNSDPVHLD